jgi:Zn-dependent protease
VHADELGVLSSEAVGAESAGDLSRALATWRRALDLVPRHAEQHAALGARIEVLSRRLDATSFPRSFLTDSRRPAERLSAAADAAVVVVASTAKILVLGLTKIGTLASLLVFFGVYWRLWAQAWDWTFAAGFVASIYVHEMGHVAALRRYGIEASTPMFLPGLGAVVRLKQYPATGHEDARVGLAGPVWGLGAALLAYGAFLLTHNRTWGAVAEFGGLINLFNLIPVWQLDGARGFRALTRAQRWIAVAVVAVTAIASGNKLLVLVGVGAALQAVRGRGATEPDHETLVTYCGLVVALAWLASLHAIALF